MRPELSLVAEAGGLTRKAIRVQKPARKMHQHSRLGIGLGVCVAEVKKNVKFHSTKQALNQIAQVPSLFAVTRLDFSRQPKGQRCIGNTKKSSRAKTNMDDKGSTCGPSHPQIFPLSHECLLTIGRLLEVDVGVAEGASGDDVAAHANREDGPDGRELLEQHRLGDVCVQISDIERSHGCGRVEECG